MISDPSRPDREWWSRLRERVAASFTAQSGGAARRLPPSGELVNVPEFEAVAEQAASPAAFRKIAGGDRSAFDRMTFRQRLMVDASQLDLTTELLGSSMFAPMLIGPVSGQRDYHPDGELETVRGAAGAKAVMVVSSESSVGVAAIAREARVPLWFQTYADGQQAQVTEALEAGVTALCITVRRPSRATAPIDWPAVDRLGRGVGVPVIVKGIMTTDDARAAIDHGAAGIVVSNHGADTLGGRPSPIDVLPTIADATGDLPLLIDGSFRRGTDILKALALGARAVLLARPVMWGLAAYGAAGVQAVFELLQNELARSMAASGRPTIEMIDRALVKIHTR